MNFNRSRPARGRNGLGTGTFLGLYFGFVFFGGSLLAPWAYWGTHCLAAVMVVPRSILESPFHRYVNRMCLVIAVAGLVPLWRQFEGGSFAGLRGCFPFVRWKDYLKGWLLGFVSLAGLGGIVMIAGGREVSATIGAWKLATHCLNAGVAALAVGFLEEVLFRGVLFRGLCKQSSFVTAAGVSSALYALVHFFRRPESPAAVEWWTGLQTLGAMAGGFLDWKSFLPSFANLFLAGSILAFVFRASGALWFSAGLHAGWVFWLKSYGRLTVPVPGGEGWFWGTDRLIDGWIATVVLVGVGVGCWFRWRGSDANSLPKALIP